MQHREGLLAGLSGMHPLYARFSSLALRAVARLPSSACKVLYEAAVRGKLVGRFISRHDFEPLLLTTQQLEFPHEYFIILLQLRVCRRPFR